MTLTEHLLLLHGITLSLAGNRQQLQNKWVESFRQFILCGLVFLHYLALFSPSCSAEPSKEDSHSWQKKQTELICKNMSGR